MRKVFTGIIFLAVLSTYLFGQVQTLKPSNYKTQDNPPNLANATYYGDCWTLEKARDKYGDSVYYYEYSARAGWYRGASTYSFGGDYRQTSQLSGETISGNYAKWFFDVDTSTSYVIYNYILTSGNAATNCFYKLYRFGESAPIDSFRYDMRLNNATGYGKPGTSTVMNGLWVPLTIVNLYKGFKGFNIVLGADTITGNAIIRADAIRILKSDVNAPDLEFGKRPRSFDSTRVEEEFGDVALGGLLDKEIKVYNLGNKELVISSFDFVQKTGRFTSETITPLRIPPGGKSSIKVRFRPYQEEYAVDTLIINSNDPQEPQAKLGLTGSGINYYFIMNASDPNNAEPHYNVPYNNPTDPNRPSYTEGSTDPAGGWLSSLASPFPFPIPGGNLKSRVNTLGSGLSWCTYKFTLEPERYGSYILEWSGPYYSTNATSKATCIVKTPFINDSVTAVFSQENLADFWRQIGTTWQLNGGAPTTIQYTNVQDAASAGGEFLRPDLLRIRKIPSKPYIASEFGLKTYYFGNVSQDENVRKQNPLSNKKKFEIFSNGESLIRIDSIYLRKGWYYKIVEKLKFPIEVPAVNGVFPVTVEFNPDLIFTGIVDTLIIKSNADNIPVMIVRLYGSGIGDQIQADDADAITYLYPTTPADFAAANEPANYGKWYFAQGGINNRRLLGRIYDLKGDPNEQNLDKKNLAYVEWYPNFPLKQGATIQSDSFDVYVVLPAGSSNSNPAVKYIVYEFGGKPTEKIVSQNAYDATNNPNGVPTTGELYLGRYQFLRGGNDTHGSGAIFGHVELWNDTSLVTNYYKAVYPNPAKRDTHYVRADAIIFREAAKPGTTYAFEPEIPVSYSLSQNYPNPFNPTTKINFSIAVFGKVSIKIYDMLGREVRTVINDNLKPGNYSIEWNGKNNYGNSVATGAYFYRITSDNFVKTKKMLLLK